jgi:hypothetical protein
MKGSTQQVGTRKSPFFENGNAIAMRSRATKSVRAMADNGVGLAGE